MIYVNNFLSDINPDLKKYYRIFLLMGLLTAINYLAKYWPDYFWDLSLYQLAINAYNSGLSAYSEFAALRFVYPPAILCIFSLFGAYLKVALTITFLFIAGVFLKDERSRNFFFYALIGSFIFFNDFIVKSFITGNITIFLHLTLITLALRGRSTTLFTVLVFAFSLVKPYFLAYLALDYFLSNDYKRFTLNLFLGFILYTVCWYLQFLLAPELFVDFLHSLEAQALGGEAGPGKDVGSAFYFFFAHRFSRDIALLMHFVTVLALAYIFFQTRLLSGVNIRSGDKRNVIIFSLLIFITFLNPRMKVYDYWILSGASIGIMTISFTYTKSDLIAKYRCVLLLLGVLFFTLTMLKTPLLIGAKIYLPPLLAFLALVNLKRMSCSSKDVNKHIQHT